MRDNIPDTLIAAFERQYDTTWNDPQLRNERMAMRYGWAAAMEAKQCLHQIQEPAPVQAAQHDAFAALLTARGALQHLKEGGKPSESLFIAALTAIDSVVIPETQAAPAAVAVPDGGTPGPWRVRKREKDGQVLGCFVTAPDCQGRAYDADILGDDYDTMERKLADCELIVAAVNAYRAALAATAAEKSNSVEFDGIKTAAPVVLPEPWGCLVEGRIFIGRLLPQHVSSMVDAEGFQPTKLYTEPQLSTLLAGVSAPAAQAVEPYAVLVREIGESSFFDSKPIKPGSVQHIHAKTSPHYDYVELYTAPQAQADARDADGMYYLQDARWSAMVGNCPSWWRPDGEGYTTNLDEAARFTFAEAMAQHRCRDTDLPWLCSEVDKLRRPTVDCQYMPRSWGEQRVQIHAQAAAKEGVQQG